MTTRLPVRDAPAPADVQRAAAILQDRIRMFGEPDAAVAAEAGRLVTVVERPPGGAPVPDGWDTLAAPLRFELRPVLGSIAAGDPGWSTTPLAACPYAAGRSSCPEGLRSRCAYADADADCAPAALEGRDVRFLGTDSASYHLGPAILTNDEVDRAERFVNGPAASVIAVDLSPEGTERLRAATTGHLGGQLAIVLDQSVISAPAVAAPIDSGRLQIVELPTGDGELLAQVAGLRTPPLPVLLRAGDTTVERRRAPSRVRVVTLAAAGALVGAGIGLLLRRRRTRRDVPAER